MKKFYRIIKILDFFEHAIILALCMFELTNVYYIYLIFIHNTSFALFSF